MEEKQYKIERFIERIEFDVKCAKGVIDSFMTKSHEEYSKNGNIYHALDWADDAYGAAARVLVGERIMRMARIMVESHGSVLAMMELAEAIHDEFYFSTRGGDSTSQCRNLSLKRVSQSWGTWSHEIRGAIARD